jgi:hypothetical protein
MLWLDVEKCFNLLFKGECMDTLKFSVDYEKINENEDNEISNECKRMKFTHDEELMLEKINKIQEFPIGFRSEDAVPDELRYSFIMKKKKKERILLNNSENIKESISKGYVNIVFILESPHRDEYQFEKNQNKYITSFPLNGMGRRKLKSFVDKEFFLNILSEENKYNLIICNPIQYQTSLYYYFCQLGENKEEYKIRIKKSLRDKIWKNIWKKEGIKKSFFKRLENYNPSVLINACTKSNGKKSIIKKAIEEYILEQNMINSIKYFESEHPSSPTFIKNKLYLFTWDYKKNNFMSLTSKKN